MGQDNPVVLALIEDKEEYKLIEYNEITGNIESILYNSKGNTYQHYNKAFMKFIKKGYNYE